MNARHSYRVYQTDKTSDNSYEPEIAPERMLQKDCEDADVEAKEEHSKCNYHGVERPRKSRLSHRNHQPNERKLRSTCFLRARPSPHLFQELRYLGPGNSMD